MSDDLRLALALADQADSLTMRAFRGALSIRTKADRTPVTEVDEAVEILIADHLQGERPDEGIIGEEFGSREGKGRVWIIDPIDGTKNFIRGIPVFATLIALADRDDSGIHPFLGVVSAPALGRRWWAERGQGAFSTDGPIHVSSAGGLSEAQLCYDDVAGFETLKRGDAFLDLTRRCGRTRGFGDFWSHMLVAEGAAEIAVEPVVALWDLAALMPIVEEAGGRFTDLSGQARPDGGSAVSTNGLLHDEILEALR